MAVLMAMRDKAWAAAANLQRLAGPAAEMAPAPGASSISP
jgi:hypothetical protein